MSSKPKSPFLLFIASCLLLSGCQKSPPPSGQSQSLAPADQQIGIIKTCQFTMGSRCGSCFCLQTDIEDCQILDYSSVGDLSAFVDQKVIYSGDKIESVNKTCPRYFKITTVELSPG